MSMLIITIMEEFQTQFTTAQLKRKPSNGTLLANNSSSKGSQTLPNRSCFFCIYTPFNRNAGIPLARTGHRCGNDYRQRRVTTSCKNCVMGFVVLLLIFNRAEIGEDFFVVIYVSRTPERRTNKPKRHSLFLVLYKDTNGRVGHLETIE